jgi:hypothetical protein
MAMVKRNMVTDVRQFGTLPYSLHLSSARLHPGTSSGKTENYLGRISRSPAAGCRVAAMFGTRLVTGSYRNRVFQSSLNLVHY